MKTSRWMGSQLVGTLRFPDCKDRHTLEGVLRNGTNRNKEMKDDGLVTHSPKEENEF